MLKPQDCVLLLKLLASPEHAKWSQRQFATALCISLSEINGGFKRLLNAGLLRLSTEENSQYPIISASKEYLIYGVKYSFATQLGEFTRGIATSYAAPVFKDKFVIGNDPIPVWPHATGTDKGVALEPLYSSVPLSIEKYPDQSFYDLLALIDALRTGRARERNLAVEILNERLKYEN